METDAETAARCYGDFPYFCEEILGFKLGSFHKEAIDTVMSNQRSAIVMPTNHGKTTLFSKSYAIWKLWRERDYNIVLASNTLSQSREVMEDVQHTLQRNDFFESILPEKRESRWNTEGMYTANRNSYKVKPFTASSKGTHPDLIICDDLLREADGNQQDIKDRFWGIFFPRGRIHQAQMVVVGTPVEPNDLLHELTEKESWAALWKSAVKLKDQNKAKNPENWKEPLWPEAFSLEDLKDIRDNMGTFHFNREFMCDPQISGSPLVQKEALLNSLDDNLGFETDVEGKVFLGCDFALSGSSYGDYSVFAVIEDLGRDYEKKILIGEKEKTLTIENPFVVRKIERYKGQAVDVQEKRIKNLYKMYSPNVSKIVLDSSTFGEVFYQDLKGEALPVEGQNFSSANRNSMLVNLKKQFESGRVVLPYAQDESYAYSTMKTVIEEIAGMHESPKSGGTYISSTAHDDTVMALALALKYCGSQKKMTGKLFFS